jgi:hypothetical protein
MYIGLGCHALSLIGHYGMTKKGWKEKDKLCRHDVVFI